MFFVGNSLMLDDGVGPAVFEQMESYTVPDDVELIEVGCMSLDQLNIVRDSDLIITVDAVDGTDDEPGTIYRFSPDDMARRSFGSQSLHDLKLSDLFDSAALLGYEAEGVCLGMQVENRQPGSVTIGLTPAVYKAIPNLVDCLLAELVQRGIDVRMADTGAKVEPGFHHTMRETEEDLSSDAARTQLSGDDL